MLFELSLQIMPGILGVYKYVESIEVATELSLLFRWKIGNLLKTQRRISWTLVKRFSLNFHENHRTISI